MKICNSCKNSYPDDVSVCPHCGAAEADVQINQAVEEVEAQKETFTAAVAEKKTLYKAADVEPERPVRNIDDAKPKKAPKRAPIVTAALWILAAAAVIGLIFGVGALFDRDDAGDVVVSDEKDPVDDLESGGADAGNDDTQNTPDEPPVEPDVTPNPPVEQKPVYDIRGTWQWESDSDGFRDTYWVLSNAGKLEIYLVGYEYDYAWPTEYSYDKDTYVLSLTDAAIGLAWLDEDTFVCGAGTARRVDTASIPEDAINVRTLAKPDEEQDPYLLPDSASRYLTEDDLAALDPDMLRFARNEIFARHGRLFSDKELQDYFNKQSWYSGYIQPANFDSSVLNDFERYNAAFIGKYEEK